MKYLISLIFVVTSLQGMAQSEIDKGLYKVIKIDTTNDYYLIFLLKDNERFTIYSEKGLAIKGQSIEVDSTYFFELIPRTDTLVNGTLISSINYLDVIHFGNYSGAEIGTLCTAKNLIGLVIKKTPCYSNSNL